MNNNENYFKDNFTKEGEKVNLEINKLTAECITSKNNKFSLDSEGNLSVNSITTNESNSQTGGNPFPIGSIYMNVNSTNPSELFGGTWEQIQDKFLLACGNTYGNGTMGGEATHVLTTAEMPSHGHSASTSTAGAHSHSVKYKKFSGLTVNGNGYMVLRRDDGSDSYDGTNNAAMSAGGHAHSVTINANGSNQAHNNMPPYLAVYIWKRVA